MIDKIKILLPGVFFSLFVTIISLLLQKTQFFTAVVPLSSLILAILIGMTVNNFFKLPQSLQPGITFCTKQILRISIILLGFKLSINELIEAGPKAIVLILISTTTTIFFVTGVGKMLGLPQKRALLLASGISICGASAVAAVDAVVKGEKEDAAFAIGVVTLLGTIYMFAYPLFASVFHLSKTAFALWAGSSIHEVAQVAAAAGALKDSYIEVLASTVKMIRVLFIIPFTLFLLVFDWQHAAHNSEDNKNKKVSVPYFAFLFFIMIAVNSYFNIPFNTHKVLLNLGSWLMTLSMAGLGLGITLSRFIQIGKKALFLGITGSFFISFISGAVLFLENKLWP